MVAQIREKRLHRRLGKKPACRQSRIIHMAKIGLAAVLVLGLAGEAIAQKGVKAKVGEEILIKVKSGIIALPQGEAASIPISAVRIRSTELRELNSEYNAITIEKLFKIKLKQETRDFGTLTSYEQIGEAEAVDISRLFTKETKKGLTAEGKQAVEVEDTYLIQFELEEGVNISQLVSNYEALECVLFAGDIIRKE